MMKKTLKKLVVASVSAVFSLGIITDSTFNQAIAVNLTTQEFQGDLILNDSLYYQGPETISYSGSVKYLDPSNGEACPEGICVPVEKNWSFKLNGDELNSSISSFTGVAIFESTLSSTPVKWSLNWLRDPTGDTGNYTVEWQQGTGISLSNSYFRGYYSYLDTNPLISYSSVSVQDTKSIPEPSQSVMALLGLATLSLVAGLKRNSISHKV
ncbi:hypothetical protein [Nostoc sp. WHI]|uniref:hypothetical protein n=1 Tax=Nostoc sp. WHI TaxID=2650611 RepID=UPI0018C812DA|nr:hypothetical protein [Nostoc sp. WHI]MBG1266287.1 hypothetical protein [Nostoc sp. WHI]